MNNNTWKTFLEKSIFVFIAIALFAVPAFFTTNINNAFTIEKHTIFRICVLVLSILTAVKWVYWPEKNKWPKVFWLVPLFWLSALLSTILASSPTLSLWGIHLRMDGWVTLSFFILFYVLIFVNIKGKNDLRWLARIIVLSSLIPVGYALMQKYGYDPISWNGVVSAERVFGTTGNPAYLAAYLMFVIPVIFYLLATTDSSYWRNGLIGLIVAEMVTVVFTMTRAAYLGLFLEIGLLAVGYFYIKNQPKLSWWLASFLVAIALFVGYINIDQKAAAYFGKNAYLQRLTEITQADSGTGRDRLEMWKIAIKAVEEHPWLGTGLTSYANAFNKYYPNYMDGRLEKDRYSNYPHNLILDYGVSLGIVGVGILLITIIFIVLTAIKKIYSVENTEQRILLWSLITAIAGYFLQALLNIETIITWTYFYAFLAIILAAVYNFNHQKEGIKTGSISILKQAGLTIFIVVCLAGLKILAIDPVRADMIYFSVSTNPKLSAAERLSLLEKAETCTPYFEYSKMKLSDWYLAAAGTGINQQSNDYYRQATEQIKKAIEISPNNFKDYYSLGLVYGSWSKSDPSKLSEAEEYLKKAVELSPNRLGIHFAWGDMYLDLGLLDQAQKQYEIARELNPEIGETYYDLAKVAVLKNDEKQTQEYLKLAAEKQYAFSEQEFWQKMSVLALQINQPQVAAKAAAKANEFGITEQQALVEIQAQLDLSNVAQAQLLAQKYVVVLPEIRSKIEGLLQ